MDEGGGVGEAVWTGEGAVWVKRCGRVKGRCG